MYMILITLFPLLYLGEIKIEGWNFMLSWDNRNYFQFSLFFLKKFTLTIGKMLIFFFLLCFLLELQHNSFLDLEFIINVISVLPLLPWHFRYFKLFNEFFNTKIATRVINCKTKKYFIIEKNSIASHLSGEKKNKTKKMKIYKLQQLYIEPKC